MTDRLDPEPLDDERFRDDPQYRWNYLKSFLDFDESDWELIQSTEPILRPAVPDIVEDLYEVFLEYEPTADLYRNEDGHFDDQLLEERIEGFELWFERIFDSNQEPEYVEYLSKVGKIHTDRMGFESMVVDEAFLNPTFTILLDRIGTTLRRELDDPVRLEEYLVAWETFFTLQLSVFRMAYD